MTFSAVGRLARDHLLWSTPDRLAQEGERPAPSFVHLACSGLDLPASRAQAMPFGAGPSQPLAPTSTVGHLYTFNQSDQAGLFN